MENNFSATSLLSSNSKFTRELSNVLKFLSDAEKLEPETSQMEICDTIARVSSYLQWCSHYCTTTLQHLQLLLSNCLKGQIDGDETPFKTLHNYVAIKSSQLEKLHLKFKNC